MSLPGITAPPGTPCFLAAGHAIDESSVFGGVKFSTGHRRTRRVRTVTERLVAVSLFLEADQMAAIDNWYEVTLQAGALAFSAHVKNQGAGPGALWWSARWVSFDIEMLAKGRGRLTGQLFLQGEGSATPPDTSTLGMEILAELVSLPGSVAGNALLGMEIVAALTQPVFLGMEIVAALTQPVPGDVRITEDGDDRATEDGTTRETEVA